MEKAQRFEIDSFIHPDFKNSNWNCVVCESNHHFVFIQRYSFLFRSTNTHTKRRARKSTLWYTRVQLILICDACYHKSLDPTDKNDDE